jgi:hypothetical protein
VETDKFTWQFGLTDSLGIETVRSFERRPVLHSRLHGDDREE